MKKIQTKDLVLIVAIVIIAIGLLIYGFNAGKTQGTVTPAQNTETIEQINPTAEPAETTEEQASTEAGSNLKAFSEAIEEAAAAYLEKYPSESYLVISTASGMYLPVPLNQDNAFRIHFGETEYNQIHIGVNSFYMEESTCDNQNCVGQGEVTLENKDSRALLNMVICLPHELSLELIDQVEAEEYLVEYYTAIVLAQAETGSEGVTENAG